MANVVGDEISGTVLFKPVQVEDGTVFMVDVDILGLDGLWRHNCMSIMNEASYLRINNPKTWKCL